MGQVANVQVLREKLMSPTAIERVKGLRALEMALQAQPDAKLAPELEAYIGRGIPFYAPEDAHYRTWVNKAVAYWEILHARPKADVPRMTAHGARSAQGSLKAATSVASE
jgi:hypothetical protein